MVASDKEWREKPKAAKSLPEGKADHGKRRYNPLVSGAKANWFRLYGRWFYLVEK
ncbi:MAG: hypothetical protein J6A47_10215 [Bacilli bacterium]|nr:hypothetical protein [Bacilli bacterium]